eukprot:9945620-Alexandrium_andersonii.AAC.1
MPPTAQLGRRDVAQDLGPSRDGRCRPFMNNPVQLLPRPGRLAQPGSGGNLLPHGRPFRRAAEWG